MLLCPQARYCSIRNASARVGVAILNRFLFPAPFIVSLRCAARSHLRFSAAVCLCPLETRGLQVPYLCFHLLYNGLQFGQNLLLSRWVNELEAGSNDIPVRIRSAALRPHPAVHVHGP